MPSHHPPFAGHPHQSDDFDARGPKPAAGEKKSLMAPWRLAYISRSPASRGETGAETCFLCKISQNNEEDVPNLVILRGKHVFVCLNLFPYSNGHLLVAPYRHVADLAEMTEPETLEMMQMAQEGCRRLQSAVNAQGFNIGLNLGACAGAGVPGHIHLHVVPRWPGDTNFMPVIGDVRVIPQALEDTYRAIMKVGSKG